jgi:hypothetical protein
LAVTKTEVVSARVPPDVKAALSAAAEAERRSVASMLEVMVLSYCREHGIAASTPASTGRSLATAPRKQRQPSS